MKYSLGISTFLEDISSLSYSIVFLYFFALNANSAFRWVYLSFSPLFFASLLFTAICKASSDSHFAFAFLFREDDLDPCLLYNVMNLHP